MLFEIASEKVVKVEGEADQKEVTYK